MSMRGNFAMVGHFASFFVLQNEDSLFIKAAGKEPNSENVLTELDEWLILFRQQFLLWPGKIFWLFPRTEKKGYILT